MTGRKKRKGMGVLALCVTLVIAAACSFLLIDPLAWWREESGGEIPREAFPGVEEPPLYPPGEVLGSRTLNVLILGLDHGMGRPQQGNERSDVIMIAHVDGSRKKTCLLSIPRDSYVQIPGHGRSKINEAYAVGGAGLAVRTVEEVTGMDIHRYLVLDFDELRWLVDLFGGVQVTLDRAISDPKTGYIPAGSSLLDGNQALVMARSRNYPQGDLERVRQQQRLIMQILYKGKEMAAYPGAAWFLSVALDSLESDLSREEVIGLAREFAAFPVVDVQGGVAPGRLGAVGGASVYLLDEARLRLLVDSIEELCTVPEEFR
ncbi:MAG: LCP family protein [Actinobacteria bacterium]|nr:LCP family protein [Actinomycetota bacterium]